MGWFYVMMELAKEVALNSQIVVSLAGNLKNNSDAKNLVWTKLNYLPDQCSVYHNSEN